MVLIDFCHWTTNTRVECDKISSDGYEVENLVSSDPSEKRKGYLAERFIKLPINITFHFPCSVSIWKIVIDPVVGSQKSSSLGVFSSLYNSQTAQTITTQDAQNKKVNQNFGSKHPEVFLARVSMPSPGKVCFYDPQFRSRPPFSSKDFESLDEYKFTSQLRHVKQVYSTNNITIRIYQTSQGSVGAIRSIEILGQPTGKCPQSLQNSLLQNYLQKINGLESVHVFSNKDELNASLQESPSANEHLYPDRRKIRDTEIPEEFIDPISCEVMAIPMLLPCKNVDKSTLDRFVMIEASWGRGPSDPFTHVLFTGESRPLPNDGLKGRIDQFLLTNKDSRNLQSMARTVSTNYDKNKFGKRKITLPYLNDTPKAETQNKDKNSETSSTQLVLPQRLNDIDIDSTSQPQAKKMRPSDFKKLNSLNLCFVDKTNRERLEGSGLTVQPNNDFGSTGLCRSSSKPSTHDQKLQNSLDSALSDVLGSYPSFTRNSNSVLPQVQVTTCNECKKAINNDTIQYKLASCSHVICRECLTSLSDISILTCKNCGIKSERNLIERQHQS